MGHQTLVYGAIECLGHAGREDADAINRAIIDGLPDDDSWPFIVRSMFAHTHDDSVNVSYACSVIHFGASYKELDEDWNRWVAKFEAILFRMQAVGAVVHIESERFGDHRLRWAAKVTRDDEGAMDWQFIDGPRTLAELQAER